MPPDAPPPSTADTPVRVLPFAAGLICPACQTPIDDTTVIRRAMSIFGARGKGQAKARSTAQAKAAAHAQWAQPRAPSAEALRDGAGADAGGSNPKS